MEGKIVYKDLLTYLQELPSAVLIDLYGYSSACLAVFRELPELSKMYVMRLLFLDQPLSMTVIDSWSHPSASSAHREALSKLQNLRVYDVHPMPGSQQGVSLNEKFRNNLRILLCGGGSPWALVGHRGGENKHSRDTAFLNEYADTQWEGVLNFMVGRRGELGAEQEVKNILLHAGLMASSSGGGLTITTRGFQFLLMERKSQVWFFILNYLKVITEREGLDLLECLTFIFQLSFSTLGKDYSREGMTPGQEQLVQHLRMCGLVYQRKRSSKRYYPTKLAINLVSGGRSSQAVSTASAGFVVIETNFRVIAYTEEPLNNRAIRIVHYREVSVLPLYGSLHQRCPLYGGILYRRFHYSQLQISILSLVCQLQYRFPNMAVGTITRESIHQALINGITAEQILSFMELHSHPQMMANNPIIPPTVTDQIRLWEMERNRLQFEEGVLYSEFMSASDFDKVKRYAEDLGVLSWSHAGKRLMVVNQSGHDEVRRFWRRQKNS